MAAQLSAFDLMQWDLFTAVLIFSEKAGSLALRVGIGAFLRFHKFMLGGSNVELRQCFRKVMNRRSRDWFEEEDELES